MPFPLNSMPVRPACAAGEGRLRMGHIIGMTTTHTAVRGT